MIKQAIFSDFIKDLAQKTSASQYITEAVTEGYKYIMENEGVQGALTLNSDFVKGYIEAMIFTGIDVDDPSGEGSSDFDIDNFSDEAKNTIVHDCSDFVTSNSDTLNAAYQTGEYDEAQAGRDFWFTRNGHGVGFWDRGLGQIGKILTDASKVYREQNAYVGDDGQIYMM